MDRGLVDHGQWIAAVLPPKSMFGGKRVKIARKFPDQEMTKQKLKVKKRKESERKVKCKWLIKPGHSGQIEHLPASHSRNLFSSVTHSSVSTSSLVPVHAKVGQVLSGSTGKFDTQIDRENTK